MKLSGLIFATGFIVAGLGFRFDWYTLPQSFVLFATAVFLLAYILYAEVLRENIYLSRTIEVQENQKVIDTGLYGIVRHPMYSITVRRKSAIHSRDIKNALSENAASEK